ncbi:hypothetical protein MYU51_017425 [Penicillium brevicompactum]
MNDSEPRTSHQSAPGATAQATTYTPFLVLSLQTTQHTLSEEGTGQSQSYRRIADKTKVALRRVPHRVLRLDLTAPTPRTAECGLSRAFGSRKLPGAPSAAYSKRQPERTGYKIIERSENFMNSAPHIPVTRVECEATNLICSSSSIPMRSQAICPFLMTTGGMDEE